MFFLLFPEIMISLTIVSARFDERNCPLISWERKSKSHENSDDCAYAVIKAKGVAEPRLYSCSLLRLSLWFVPSLALGM